MQAITSKTTLSVITLIFCVAKIAGCNTEEVSYLVIEEQPFVQIISATGRLLPARRVQLQSEVAARLVSLPFDEGDKVEAGTLLARLDDSDARNRLEEGRATLALAQARARSLAEISLPSVREEIKQLELNRQKLSRTLERQETLHKRGSISLDVLEETRTAYALLESQIRIARTALRSRESGGAEAATIAAEVNLARTNLRVLEEELNRFVISAPFDGIVLQRLAEEGELTQPGSILLVFAPIAESLARLDIDERVIGLIQKDQRARIWPEAFPSQTIPAKVHAISPTVNPNTGSVQVQLQLKEEPGFSLQDLTIRAEIEIRQLERAIILPSAYLWRQNPQRILVSSNSTAVERLIKTEPAGVSRLMVVEGLSPGEIVIDPLSGISPGDSLTLGNAGTQ